MTRHAIYLDETIAALEDDRVLDPVGGSTGNAWGTRKNCIAAIKALPPANVEPGKGREDEERRAFVKAVGRLQGTSMTVGEDNLRDYPSRKSLEKHASAEREAYEHVLSLFDQARASGEGREVDYDSAETESLSLGYMVEVKDLRAIVDAALGKRR
jgi:hypothetical protein